MNPFKSDHRMTVRDLIQALEVMDAAATVLVGDDADGDRILFSIDVDNRYRTITLKGE